MINEDLDLFGIKFNDEGKKFIRKFAALSYSMLVLVIFGFGVSIYLSIKSLVTRQTEFNKDIYDLAYPYVSIFFSVFGVASNIFYLRCPRMLFRSINNNDEIGANRAFRGLFRGALIYFLSLLLGAADAIWSLMVNQNY